MLKKAILKYLSILYFIVLLSLIITFLLSTASAQTLSGPAIKTMKQFNNSRYSLRSMPSAPKHITGSGTEIDPYLLYDASDFDSIRYLGFGSEKYYELASDIDLSSFSPWIPFGTAITVGNRFEAKLNGNNKKIRNLTLNPNLDYPSLLGLVNGTTVSNLTIENTSLNFTGTSARQYTGILMARNYSAPCTLKNIYIDTVNINYRPTNSISTFFFGAFGQSTINLSQIHDCHIRNFNADIRVATSSGNSVGAFISTGAFAFLRCSFVGVLNSERTNTNYQLGGLFAGNNLLSGSSITDCFAIGQIKTSETYAASTIRLAAFTENRVSITRCYSAVVIDDSLTSDAQSAFIVDYNTGAGTVTNCYYDKTLFNRDGVGGGSGAIGKTTEELKTQSTFTGWDFTNTWAIDSTINNGYPYLISNE